MISPEEFAHVLDRGIVLNLDAYKKLGFKNKIYSNTTDAASTGVAIVDGKSQKDVDLIMDRFPKWLKTNWTIRPLRRN
jgi:hypothetical protein